MKRREAITHTSESDADTPTPIPFKYTLDTGSVGPKVLWAQARLIEHGVLEGPMDGKYSRAMRLAVRAWQAQQGLPVTGAIDRKTWGTL